jgi:hypothetical protein
VSRDSGLVLIAHPARLSCRPLHVAPACSTGVSPLGRMGARGPPIHRPSAAPLGGISALLITVFSPPLAPRLAVWTELRVSRRVSAEWALSAIMRCTCGALFGTRSMPDSNLWWRILSTLSRLRAVAKHGVSHLWWCAFWRAFSQRYCGCAPRRRTICPTLWRRPRVISQHYLCCATSASLPRCCGAGQYSTPSWFHAVAMVWSVPLSVVLARLPSPPSRRHSAATHGLPRWWWRWRLWRLVVAVAPVRILPTLQWLRARAMHCCPTMWWCWRAFSQHYRGFAAQRCVPLCGGTHTYSPLHGFEPERTQRRLHVGAT